VWNSRLISVGTRLLCHCARKTHIYAMIVSRSLKEQPSSRVVIFVPWRPLAVQTCQMLGWFMQTSSMWTDATDGLNSKQGRFSCASEKNRRVRRLYFRVAQQEWPESFWPHSRLQLCAYIYTYIIVYNYIYIYIIWFLILSHCLSQPCFIGDTWPHGLFFQGRMKSSFFQGG